MAYGKHAKQVELDLDKYGFADDWAKNGKHARHDADDHAVACGLSRLALTEALSEQGLGDEEDEVAQTDKYVYRDVLSAEWQIDSQSTGRLPVSRKRFPRTSPYGDFFELNGLGKNLSRAVTNDDIGWSPDAIDTAFGSKIKSGAGAPKKNQEQSGAKFTDDKTDEDEESGNFSIGRPARFNWKTVFFTTVIIVVFALLVVVALYAAATA